MSDYRVFINCIKMAGRKRSPDSTSEEGDLLSIRPLYVTDSFNTFTSE